MKAAGDAGGTPLAPAAEFCALPHEVRFRVTAPSPPALGDTVRLARGTPPTLLNGSGVIGVLQDRAADAMNGCLALDWEMAGTIISVDEDSVQGVARIAGVR